MEAAAGIVGSGVPLALVPGGTGNLLAVNLGVPLNPAKAADVICSGKRRAIDLGRVERADGTRYFAVASGAGLDAEIMKGATPQMKRRWGSGAYVGAFLGLLDRLTPVPHRITVDERVLELESTTVVVANCGWVANVGINLGPGIVQDDGLLDVVAFRGKGLMDGAIVLWELYTGRGNGMIVRDRGRVITVESEQPRLVQMDGDLAGETPFTATVLPRGLEVLVPAGSLVPGAPPGHIAGMETRSTP
jgi:diacylglycerol kinase family enzyme